MLIHLFVIFNVLFILYYYLFALFKSFVCRNNLLLEARLFSMHRSKDVHESFLNFDAGVISHIVAGLSTKKLVGRGCQAGNHNLNPAGCVSSVGPEERQEEASASALHPPQSLPLSRRVHQTGGNRSGLTGYRSNRFRFRPVSNQSKFKI